MERQENLSNFDIQPSGFIYGRGRTAMIGEVLKKIRIIYGYTAKELSRELEISGSYLSEIENNKKAPSLELLQKYSEIFGIKVSSLILLSEDMEEATAENKGQDFIKHMMFRLVNFMAKDAERSDEKAIKEV